MSEIIPFDELKNKKHSKKTEQVCDNMDDFSLITESGHEGDFLVTDPIHYYIDYEYTPNNSIEGYSGPFRLYNIVKTFDEFLKGISPEYLKEIEKKFDGHNCRVVNIKMDALEYYKIEDGMEKTKRVSISTSHKKSFGVVEDECEFSAPKKRI